MNQAFGIREKKTGHPYTTYSYLIPETTFPTSRAVELPWLSMKPILNPSLRETVIKA